MSDFDWLEFPIWLSLLVVHLRAKLKLKLNINSAIKSKK